MEAKGPFMWRAITILTALAVASPALAAGPRDKLVVEPAWLAKHLGDKDLVILQVGDKPSYDAGHIPGARLVAITDFAAPPVADGLTLELPDAAVLHEKLLSLGVTDKSTIVVTYGKDVIQSATRVVFTLDDAGLGARTVLLDGGLNAWVKAGQKTTTDVPAAATPGKLAALTFKAMIVDADFVKSHINTPGYSIVDARAPEFYSGARAGGSTAKPQKAGHIASAKSVPFSAVTDKDLTLLSGDELAAKFKAAGVKPGDTVVAYCHVGQQATAALFAARTLGFNVLLYDGSFEDWSKKDGPTETAK